MTQHVGLTSLRLSPLDGRRKIEYEIVKGTRILFCGRGPWLAHYPERYHHKGYQMVPYNFQVLAKIGLSSICSQKLDGCSLTRARKIFAIARMLGFSITRNFVNRDMQVFGQK